MDVDQLHQKTGKKIINLNHQASDSSYSFKPIYSTILEQRQEQGKHLAIVVDIKSSKDKGWRDAIMGGHHDDIAEEYLSDSLDFTAIIDGLPAELG